MCQWGLCCAAGVRNILSQRRDIVGRKHQDLVDAQASLTRTTLDTTGTRVRTLSVR